MRPPQDGVVQRSFDAIEQRGGAVDGGRLVRLQFLVTPGLGHLEIRVRDLGADAGKFLDDRGLASRFDTAVCVQHT